MYFEIKSKSASWHTLLISITVKWHSFSSTLRVSTRVYGDSLKASASLAFIPHMPRDVIVDIVMERKIENFDLSFLHLPVMYKKMNEKAVNPI